MDNNHIHVVVNCGCDGKCNGGGGNGGCGSCDMEAIPVIDTVVIQPDQPDIGVDVITGTYNITISEGCGTDISTYAYVSNQAGGTILQSGTIEVSGVIPPYTPIPSDSQKIIHVEITPRTSCNQTGATQFSNTVEPEQNP